MAYKSLRIKGFLQRIWHMDPRIWSTNPPPILCHMNRFIVGGGGLRFVDERPWESSFLLFTLEGPK